MGRQFTPTSSPYLVSRNRDPYRTMSHGKLPLYEITPCPTPKRARNDTQTQATPSRRIRFPRHMTRSTLFFVGRLDETPFVFDTKHGVSPANLRWLEEGVVRAEEYRLERGAIWRVKPQTRSANTRTYAAKVQPATPPPTPTLSSVTSKVAISTPRSRLDARRFSHHQRSRQFTQSNSPASPTADCPGSRPQPHRDIPQRRIELDLTVDSYDCD